MSCRGECMPGHINGTWGHDHSVQCVDHNPRDCGELCPEHKPKPTVVEPVKAGG